jgi:hypothetical protein
VFEERRTGDCAIMPPAHDAWIVGDDRAPSSIGKASPTTPRPRSFDTPAARLANLITSGQRSTQPLRRITPP